MAVRTPPSLTPDGETLKTLPESLVRALSQVLNQLRYGTVEIVIQDGKIIQINKTEKIRF